MLSFINILKKVFALFSVVALFITGGINSVFNGDVYKCEYSDGVVGLETLIRAQGVTTDGKSWFFSGKNTLEKVNIKTGEIEAINLKAVPDELKEKFGVKHIGGISFADGKIYAAVEDSKVWLHPLVVVFDADTLTFTGEYHELPVENHTRGVPYCFVDAQNGVVFAGNSRNETKIFMYDINSFSYLGAVEFSEELTKIQGGEYYDGRLFLGTNDKKRAVYEVDAKTGEVTKLFDRISYEYKLIDNFGGEGEDITVFMLEDGTFIHTLQVGASFTDATLRHYLTPGV